MSYHPLSDCIAITVPMYILRLSERGGPCDAEIEAVRGVPDVIAQWGDVLVYRGPRPGEATKLFNEVAWAIAVAAFLPGGIEIFGSHFEVMPPDESNKDETTS